MVKVYGTNAVDYVNEKLGFVEDFAEGEVVVRINETKASDLRVASINYRLEGHPKPVNISTDEHRSVKKSIDMLADKVSVKIAKDQDKYEARKRKRRRKLEKERLEAIKDETADALIELEEELNGIDEEELVDKESSEESDD